jgi:hypothetical protein
MIPADHAQHAAPPSMWQRWRPFVRRGLVTQLFCVVIALLLWSFAAGHGGFAVKWIYSAAIGTCCWLFIEAGRHGAAVLMNRRRAALGQATSAWPGLPWMLACMAVGTVLGFTLGHHIGDLVTGQATPGLLPDRLTAVVSMLTTVVATYFFYSVERLGHERAAAESARRLALENQLRLLESQLEPHMLFNTLANLRVLIGLDPPRAQAMLDRLIAYLRATLAASRERTHPLATEFDRLADYLALMAVRMGPRLQYTLDLPDSLKQHPVPPLLLQPLVENAIKHGLEPQVEGGRIEVSAARHGALLRLEVRDTGAGLAAPSGPARAYAHFGTRHIAERLQAMYGAAATFTLAPAGDARGGTLARIDLPLAEAGLPQAAAPAAPLSGPLPTR